MHRLSLLCLALLSVSAAADVAIGQVVPQSAPTLADDARVASGTLRACFDSINARGGIHGQKLTHLVRDDGYDAGRHVAASKELIDKEGVVALIGAAGIAGPLALLKQKVLDEGKTPLIGPIIGANQLRYPMNPWMFHTRASWDDEIRKIIEQMKAVGQRRVAVLYQDDADGRSGLFVVKQLVKKNELELVATAPYDLKSNDVSAATKTILDANPDAIFLGGLEEAGGRLLKGLRAAGNASQLYAVSVVDAKRLFEVAGSAARGSGISQTMPYPYAARTAVVKEYQATMKKYGPEIPINYLGMETYINCRVLAEGLKRAGPKPTGEKLMQALQGIADFDLGGYRLGFAPDNRIGSRFVEITVMDGSGGVMR